MQPRVAADNAAGHLQSIAPGRVGSLANEIQRLLALGCPWLEACPRLPASELTRAKVRQLVEHQGMPIVFEKCMHPDFGNSLFSPQWLIEHYGNEDLGTAVRNVDTLQDLTGWTHGKYIREHLNRPLEHRRGNLYAKDVPVPAEWTTWFLQNYEHFYAYSSTDLIARLPKPLQPSNLMAYIGCEGNRTPAHIDMIGAVGHNLMTYADPGAYSIWFLSKTSDRPAIMKYMLSKGAHLIHDSFVFTLADLKASGVKWTVLIQRFGDFVFVPPDSCHQVINGGEKTIKVAWNRYTPFSLAHAIRQVLPIYHDYLKPETYRTKTIVQHVIQQHVTKFHEERAWTADMRADLETLLPVLEEILFEETISEEMIRVVGAAPVTPQQWTPSKEEPLPHSRVCNYCCNDIWQRWYSCPACPDDFDICLQCVAKRRGCVHGDSLVLCQFEDQANLVKLIATGKAVLLRAAGIELPEIDCNRWSWGSLAFRQVVLNSQSKGTKCHFCNQYTQPRALLQCSDAECGTSYCHNCLFQKHGILVHEAARTLNWKCPFCTGTCRCSARACRLKSGQGPVPRETLCALLGSADVFTDGPPLTKWYNRPPPLQTHFGPELQALKLLGPCDVILARHSPKTVDMFAKVDNIDAEQSDCSDEDLLERVGALLQRAFTREWMPGLNAHRKRQLKKFFPSEQPYQRGQGIKNARIGHHIKEEPPLRNRVPSSFASQSGTDPVTMAILNRNFPEQRNGNVVPLLPPLSSSASALLYSGVALVDCAQLPSWPAALVKSANGGKQLQSNRKAVCLIMLLGMPTQCMMIVPANRVRPCQSMDYWTELEQQSCCRDLPEFARQANVSLAAWRTINRQFSKAVSEAILIYTKLLQQKSGGVGGGGTGSPNPKRRKLDANGSFV